MDYILLIMNCEKYRFKALKQTWVQQLPAQIKYFYVLGNPALESEYEFIGRILYVKTEDDYNSLPKKVIKAYQAIHDTFDYKYIFKTDDDQMLIESNFFNVLINLLQQQNYNYGGHIVNVRKAHYSQYYLIHDELPNNIIVRPTIYCSGRFYFLSHDAVKDLLTKATKINNEYFEDYAIGYYLDVVLKSRILPLKTHKYFKDMEL